MLVKSRVTRRNRDCDITMCCASITVEEREGRTEINCHPQRVLQLGPQSVGGCERGSVSVGECMCVVAQVDAYRSFPGW